MTAPSRRDYADADRLLVAACTLDAVEVRRWIEATKPDELAIDLRGLFKPDLTRTILWGLAVLLFAVSLLLIAGAS